MTQIPSKPRTLVSVILAAYNEAEWIRGCLASLLAQETQGFDLEILAVDGLSTDGTREFLEKTAASDSRVRVYVNEKRTTPSAFNLGLAAARGEYICIFGAHTVYSKNYISVCLQELRSHGAVLCGGRVITRPSANNLQARLVASALGHPFGSSRKSFRTQPQGFSGTVNYPVLWKEALVEIGGLAEDMLCNEDDDFHQRLSANGHKLFHTWKTHCFYHSRGTIGDLLALARRNGFWNAVSLRRNAASMSPRHFVPFVFLISLLLCALIAIAGVFSHVPHRAFALLPLVALLGLHFGAGSIAAIQIAVREKFLGAIWLPFVFLAFHFCYGFGTFWAFVTRAKPRPRDPVHRSLLTAKV